MVKDGAANGNGGPKHTVEESAPLPARRRLSQKDKVAAAVERGRRSLVGLPPMGYAMPAPEAVSELSKPASDAPREPVLPENPAPPAEASAEELPGSPPPREAVAPEAPRRREDDMEVRFRGTPQRREEAPPTAGLGESEEEGPRPPGKRTTPTQGWTHSPSLPVTPTLSSIEDLGALLSTEPDGILHSGPLTGDRMSTDEFARLAGMPAKERTPYIEGLDDRLMEEAHAPMENRDEQPKVEIAVLTFRQRSVPTRHMGEYSDTRPDGTPKNVRFREEAEKELRILEGYSGAAGGLADAIGSRISSLRDLKKQIEVIKFLEKELGKSSSTVPEAELASLVESKAMSIRLRFFREEALENAEVPGRVKRLIGPPDSRRLEALEARMEKETSQLREHAFPLLEAHHRAKLFIAKSAERMPELEERPGEYDSVVGSVREHFSMPETAVCKDELEKVMSIIKKHFLAKDKGQQDSPGEKKEKTMEQIISKMIKEERWDYEEEEIPLAKKMATAAGEIGALFEAVFENEAIFRELHMQEEDGMMTAGELERKFAEALISSGKGSSQAREMNAFDAFAKGVMFAALGKRRMGALFDILGDPAVSRPYGKLGGVPALGVYVALDLFNRNKSEGDMPEDMRMVEAYKLVKEAPLASLIHDLVDVTVNWPGEPAIMGKFENFVRAELVNFQQVVGDYMAPEQFIHYLTLEGITEKNIRDDPFLKECFGEAATGDIPIYRVTNDIFDAFLLIRQYYHAIVEPFSGGDRVKDEFFKAYMGNYSSNPFCQAFGIALFASQRDIGRRENKRVLKTFKERKKKCPNDAWVTELMEKRIASLPEERRTIDRSREVDLDAFDARFDERVSRATMPGTTLGNGPPPGSKKETDFGDLND